MKTREFLIKVYIKVKKDLLFFNIRNNNIKELAERERCYKLLKRKFKKDLINEYNPVKKEYSNKIWICWFQGIENAPKLVQKCISSIKKYYPNKEIIVITNDNYKDYVEFPDYIIKKWKKGYISFAHFSDLLRLELLVKYGGLWIDSTVFMTSENYLFDENDELFVFKNISLNKKDKLSVSASNWLIYSCKDNNILKLTKKLLYSYWKKYNYAVNYNIFHLFFTMATEIYSEEWKKVRTFSNIPPHILQFELKDKFNKERFNEIKKMSCFHKLDRRMETTDVDSNYYYIINN